MYYRGALIGLLLCGLGACSGSQQSTQPAQVHTPQLPAPVGEVTLNHSESPGPDIGLVVFDPGIPDDESTHSERAIFPEIRRAEARYLPVTLRRVLEDAGAWGVVRVLPEADAAAELLVQARIVHSDGLRLALAVRATDASGRLWLERTYVDESSAQDYPVSAGSDPYIDLYRQLANDLLAVRDGLSARQLQSLRDVALLRYAAGLSPEAFGSYLQRDSAGHYQLLRLPAEDDPMLRRVQRIRNQEYQFIDHIDDQYLQLRSEMGATYDLWRQYSREQALYRVTYQQRVAQRETQGRRGSFLALQQTYNAYKWTKIQQQDLTELAGGFRNEVAPTVMSVGDQVYRLGGTLSSQYEEWRGILRQIFALETGL